MAVILKILSLFQHLHLQIDLWEGICIACDILFKDHMCACQWSDTGPPGPLVYVPCSDSGDILFLPCLFVCWTTLTLVTSFEPFQIEPSYLACRFLVTRASHSYKNIDL